MQARPSADTFRNIQDLLRRRRFRSALHLINAQLEGTATSTATAESRQRWAHWTVLQVYCHLRLENFLAAAAPLDKLPPLPETEDDVLANLTCGSETFSLRLLAAVFPLCYHRYAARDVTQLPTEPPRASGPLLDRLYLLLDWIRRSQHLCASRSELGHLQDVWQARHVLTVRVLVNALLQLELFHAALELVDTELLRQQPESALGLLLAGRICLTMGSLDPAEYHFGVAECLCDPLKSKPITSVLNATLLLAQGNTAAAITELETVMGGITQSSTSEDGSVAEDILFHSPTQGASTLQKRLEEAVAQNNLSVALLYSGTLKEAARYLEEALMVSPQPVLFLAPLRNLLTFHEFSPQRSRKIAALRKKLHELGTEELELLHLFSNESR